MLDCLTTESEHKADGKAGACRATGQGTAPVRALEAAAAAAMAAPKAVGMAGPPMGVGDHTGVAADPMGRDHMVVLVAAEVRGQRDEEGCDLWFEVHIQVWPPKQLLQ